MKKGKKEYIIVGGDNYWYASGLKSIKEVKDEIENIKEYNILDCDQKDFLRSLYVYEVQEVMDLSCDLE